VSDVSYAYYDNGNVESESDSVTGDYQCYQYDYAGRLADAWAQGTSGCAATPSASVLGGPDPYWQHLAYDPAGNITTDNFTYNSADTNYSTTASSFGPAQPHTLTSQNVVSSYFGAWTNHDSYDAAGNLTDLQSGGTLQQLTWNDQDQLSQVIDNYTDTTSYVYDASGSLLLQTDNTTATLYLPGEQITENTSTGQVSGTRYYTIGGVTVAARPSAGDVQYLIADQHGTDTLAIDAATLTPTYRYYTPFGQQRGLAPAAWPGTKGFVGGSTDTVTSLVNLGAREYDPTTGTFISPDPLLVPDNPQDLNPYAYATSNPTTDQDPTGALPVGPGGSGCSPGTEYLEICGGNGHPGSSDTGGSTIGDYNSGGGRTNPTTGSGSSNPLGNFYCPPQICGHAIPVVVTPSIRVITAHQASNGLPECASGVESRLVGGGDCMPAPVPSGDPFSWLSKHWRGLAQVGIGVVTGVALIACVASVICGAGALATIAGTALIGASAGAASYGVSGGRHTGRGFAVATAWGAVAGATSGTGSVLLGGVLLEGGAATIMAASGAVNGAIYMFTKPASQQTYTGQMTAIALGMLGSSPLDAALFGWDK
jgi:RHS repeat-associated protein